MNKKRIFFILTLVFFAVFSIDCLAASVPEGFSQLLEGLEENSAGLPEGLYSENADEVGDAVTEMSGSGFWFSAISDILKDELFSFTRLFAKLCGLIILSAVFGALCRSLSSEALSGAMRFCTTTAIFAAIIHAEAEHLLRVELFFDRLLALMGTMIPITGTVWAMGGNVSTASASTSTLYVFLGVCEGICGRTVIPVCCLFTAFALCNTLSPEMGLSGFSSALKKIYTFMLGMIMTVLMASLASQTALNSAADSAGARAAKLVSANVIPVVGASVGDTLRTIASSVGYLKSIVGIGGIFFILLLLLPVLMTLVMTRLAFLLSSGVAQMLGCDTEGRFLSELGGVYGIMVAVVSMSSVMFIFALTIFSKTVVAIA